MWFQNHLWTLTNKTLFLTDDSVRSDLKHNVVHANIVLWQEYPRHQSCHVYISCVCVGSTYVM